MQTASAKRLPAIFFTIKKYLDQTQILHLDAWAWAQCLATIRTAERCRNTAGMHIHVGTLKSFSWAVYPFGGHLEGAGAHPSCMWAEAGSWCEHLGFGSLTQGYLSSAVKVSGHLPRYQNTVQVFSCAGIGTNNPPLHSPAPNRLSNHHPWLWGTKVKKNIDLTPKLLWVFIPSNISCDD